MPVIRDFKLPGSPDSLDLTATSTQPFFFISFHASPDPNTGKPWCPDVVAALPYLQEAFSGPNTPWVAFIEVGQKPEWKDLSNIYRTIWKVNSIPTLVRYERVKGKVEEVGRLVEGEILDRARLDKFVNNPSRQI